MFSRYFVQKAVRYVAIFFIVLLICFLIPRMMPGDPVANILGLDYDSLPKEEVERMYHELGLDKSLPEQFVDYVKSVFTMNLGYSTMRGELVTDIIMGAFVRSAVVLVPSLLIGSAIALVLGVRFGLRDDRITRTVTGLAIFVHSAPVFLVGMAGILIFSYELGILPFGHLTSIGKDFSIENIADIIYHLILPVGVMSTFVATSYYILMKNATRQISNEFFITVERAHGMGEEKLRDDHVSRNIMPQFVSMFAISISSIISGSVVLEMLFSIDGMGVVLNKAVMSSDYMLMQGIFIVIIIFTLLANFIAELLYGYLDPRISDGEVHGDAHRCA
jgi:peptide/nickel transport system permease protein